MADQRRETVPRGTWDTHLHILDPRAFPYAPNRLYTPAPGRLDELMASTFADCFLVVQASVEDGTTSILTHLRLAAARYPSKTFRAEIEIPATTAYTDLELRDLDDKGVRAIRLHGVLGWGRDEVLQGVQKEFVRLAAYARRTGWFLSSMCALETWVELAPWLVESPDLENVRIIVEHNIRIDPSTDVASNPGLDGLLDLFAQHPTRFFVKICGLNRLEARTDVPGRMSAIPAPILSIVERLPDQVLWGSDWPHTNFESKTLAPVANKNVNLENELALLKLALPPSSLQKLLVDNAERLFR
ncbi:hypothetical protein CLAIMM_01970 [Cladophialophora immunda]|nr:hypothetical protein CLAIMM_01970 [Cladophialophora immunda]